jgi:CHAD domain-containing protein
MSTSIWNNSRSTGKSVNQSTSDSNWLKQLSSTWIGTLRRCLEAAGIEEVHRVRTGTRRLEAHLESLLEREKPRAGTLTKSATSWMRQMKKIRRAAGAIRDLDVHRKLMEKFTGVGKAGHKLHEEGKQGKLERGTPTPQEKSLLEDQAKLLDDWLRDERDRQVSRLQRQIEKRLPRVEELSQRFFEAHRSQPLRFGPRPQAETMALKAFARLSSSMPQLNAGNLHEFRKEAKKARYLTESSRQSVKAKQIGEMIKQIQDEIGDWHDWLSLTEEARVALKDEDADLVKRLEEQVAESYRQALNTTEKLRPRLVEQWKSLNHRSTNQRKKTSDR